MPFIATLANLFTFCIISSVLYKFVFISLLKVATHGSIGNLIHTPAEIHMSDSKNSEFRQNSEFRKNSECCFLNSHIFVALRTNLLTLEKTQFGCF